MWYTVGQSLCSCRVRRWLLRENFAFDLILLAQERDIMVTLQGKSVYRDICIGKLVFYGGQREIEILQRTVEDQDTEILRYEKAVMTAKQQLRELYEDSVRRVGEANAAIFQVQELLLEDDEYQKSVRSMITEQKVNVEYAVRKTGDAMAQMLQSVEDAYIREKAQDVEDVTGRLLRVLEGDFGVSLPREPFIVAAKDLLPSEAVQLSGYHVQGFALCEGSTHSHMAILARSMGVPALMKLGGELSAEWDGVLAVVDGFAGVLYIDPDPVTLAAMEEKKRESWRHKELLRELKGKANITRDGKQVKLFANAGSLADVEAACANDAGGIGLFRSELLYLESLAPPDEETQFSLYRQVLQTMEEREVVIRTFDFGADKQVHWLRQEREENPALGLRAIRLGLERPELLKAQLRALYRAAVYGKLRIMYPMITSVEEVRQLKQIEEQAKMELKKEGAVFEEKVPTGIMIETPAAAVLSDLLAKEVDFFSVGTNDLTQYALALDRQNSSLERFGDPAHRAVLRLVEMAARNAHAAGIWIGICGEMAADTAFTGEFLRMGIDELSVSPGMILELRGKIREL